MPVLRLQPSVWLPRHAIYMNKNYLYCGPGTVPRQVKIVGYSHNANKTAQFLCRDVLADGTVPTGPGARSEWVHPWFKAVGYMPIDWQKHARMTLTLQLSEQVEGSHRG